MYRQQEAVVEGKLEQYRANVAVSVAATLREHRAKHIKGFSRPLRHEQIRPVFHKQVGHFHLRLERLAVPVSSEDAVQQTHLFVRHQTDSDLTSARG